MAPDQAKTPRPSQFVQAIYHIYVTPTGIVYFK
jgi:hypothetical protein